MPNRVMNLVEKKERSPRILSLLPRIAIVDRSVANEESTRASRELCRTLREATARVIRVTSRNGKIAQLRDGAASSETGNAMKK